MHESSNPLKLGYLVPQFPGQTHIFFWREIAELEKRGVQVHLLSTKPPPAGLIAHDWSEAAMARTTYLASLHPVHALRAALAQPWGRFAKAIGRDGGAVARDIAICLPAAARLYDYSKRHQLDHIHVHSCARAALVAAMAHKMGGPSYSVTLHGPMSDYGKGQDLKWRDARFATIITRKLINEAKELLGGALPASVYLRPMGVDTEVLKRTQPYLPPAQNGPLRLFSCARLNVVKGHQDVMQAVADLRAQGRDVQLDIAGEDDAGGSGFRAELEATIDRLNLHDAVRLLGAIDATAVKEHLLKAHLFVLASWHEPLGVAYMEAMSCGTPTIGTASGGVRELFSKPDVGHLVAPKAPKELAEAIARLADDPDQLARMSAAGRAHVVANYRADLGAQTLIDALSADPAP